MKRTFFVSLISICFIVLSATAWCNQVRSNIISPEVISVVTSYNESGRTVASNLFISEYFEGSSNKKAIEIFNGTGATVNLASYSLKKQVNGAGAFGNELVLSGSLVNNDVYVIVLSASSGTTLVGQPYVDLATNSNAMTFNGNDCVALYQSGTQIDVVGIVNQVANWGADMTLVRKSSIISPTTSYAIADWDQYALDTTTYLGAHTFSPTPISEIAITGTLSAFSTNSGVASAAQSYLLSGTNLTGDINLTAGAPFEIMVDGTDDVYRPNQTVASDFTGYIFVRISSGAPEGTTNTFIYHNSTGAADVNLAASATVYAALTPVINVTGTLTPFSTVFGTPSAAQSYTLSGTNISGVINLTAPNGFEISVDGEAGTYAQYRFVTSSFSGLIYVRLTGTVGGALSGDVLHESTGATSVNLPVSGTVAMPTINATSTMTAFTAYTGTPSTPQSYTLSGSNLTANIDLTAPTGFEISVDGISGTYAPNRTVTSAFSGSIFVRLTGVSNGAYSGNITHTSVGASQVNVAVSGSVTSAPAVIFEENFAYVATTTAVSNGWSAHSGAGSNSPTITASGLTYTDYPSVSGNAVQTLGTGEDINKTFVAQTTGSVYGSVLINVTSVSEAGDYAFHFSTNPISSDFRGKIFVGRNASNKVRFGLTKAANLGASVVWTDYVYDLATTYLLVLKYDNISGLTNDTVSLWVNPAISAFEPVATLTATDVTGADFTTGVGSVAIRQSNTTPVAIYDGIRVAKSWINLLEPNVIEAGIGTGIGDVVVNSDIQLGYTQVLITDPSIPAIPNSSGIVNPTVIIFNAPAGTADMSFDVGAGTWYGMIYYSGSWHAGTPYPVTGPGTISFNGVPFGAKADVPVVVSEGDGMTLPVTFSSFTAVLTAQNYVNLTWVSQSETDMSGYNVYRNVSSDLETAIKVSNLIPATNTSSETTYTYADQEVENNATYYYWLEATELNNTSSFHGPVSVIIGNGGEVVPPPLLDTRTCIDKVYPNPFNPRTEIAYNLKDAAPVTLAVFNQKGQLIRTLINADKASGYHKILWDGNDSNGIACASGIYYVQMTAGKVTSSRKLVLMK